MGNTIYSVRSTWSDQYIGLEGYGLRIVERVPIQLPPGEHNRGYLQTKKDKLGHLLGELGPTDGA